MSENYKNAISVSADGRSKIWFLSLPVLAIILHYIMSNILYVLMGKLLIDALHLSNERAMEFYYLGETLIYILLIVMFFTIYKVTTGKDREELRTLLNTKDTAKTVAIGLGVAGMIYLLILVMEQIPALEKSLEIVNGSGGSGGNFLGTIVVSAILAPVIEEILFRGIVFKSLKKVSPVFTAVIVSSVLFGIYHMNIVSAVYASCMGVIAAIVYEKTNNLVFPIFVHITNNFLAAMQEFVPKTVVNIINIFSIIMIPVSAYMLYTFFRTKRTQIS